jgi:ABC-2 type transport system permease protein
MRVYLALISASLRTQLAYRRSFLLELAGRLVITGLELAAVFVLFSHIDELAGWARHEVIYLFAIGSLSLGLTELLTDGLKDMPELVRRGGLDRLLVRPFSPLLQLLARRFRLMHTGRMAQGVFALGLALSATTHTLGPVEVVTLLGSVLATVLVFGGVFVAGAATTVFTVQSAEAFHAFTYGGLQMSQYPLTVYKPWLQVLFVAVIPVGFVTYFPALVVLHKPDALGMPAFTVALTPVVACGFAALALWYWRFCLAHYQSTGS